MPFGETDRSPAKTPGRGSTRREFLVALGLTTAAAAGVQTTGAMERFADWLGAREKTGLKEKIEEEKIKLRELITQGIENANWVKPAIVRQNQLVDELRTLKKDAPEYQKLDTEEDTLHYRLRQLTFYRGGQGEKPLQEANKYADQLMKNETALAALAAARVLLREKSGGLGRRPAELTYWHNCALAYLKMAKLSAQDTDAKVEELCKYADENDLDLSEVQFEKILYYLIDDGFDLGLNAKKMSRQLDRLRPDWQKFPATHVNKECYSHYNDLSTLDVFERNRLRVVAMQMSDPQFVRAMFAGRDADLMNYTTEFGGVIPLQQDGHQPSLLATKRVEGNESYAPTNEGSIRGFAGAASFHYHATTVEEDIAAHGPSGADFAYFFPGVVFSSADKDTVVVHFYVGKGRDHWGGNFEHKSDVVCLGQIKRPPDFKK
ncbi:MAG: hypothetical protein Q7K39_04780 [Candidatus Magasanikbacteria bacterium]|nr:hypothetical protein [Candidatus Magasanikbacteria bacterium]